MSTNPFIDPAIFGAHPSTYGCEAVEGVNWGRIERPRNLQGKTYRLVDGELVEVEPSEVEEPRS